MLKSCTAALLGVFVLQGCGAIRNFDPPERVFDLFRAKGDRNAPRGEEGIVTTAQAEVDARPNAIKLAPDQLALTGRSVWDGRPSFGGIWVASPDSRDPMQVLITNKNNGKQVVGAFFFREIYFDGPPIQMSSEAAAALGVQAGSVVNLSIVAVKK